MFLNNRSLKFFIGFAVVFSLVYLIYYSSFKYYWHDEVLNLLAISGYDQESLIQTLYDGNIKTQVDFFQFQGVNQDKNLGDTISYLIKTSNYELPLYYSLLWIWAKIWGNSDLALRSLSVIIWFVFLLCIYYLSIELFDKKSTALLSTILIWLSPRFLGYSLDVWEYSLYACLTALSSLLFLKAFNSQNLIKWLFYSFAIIAGLYTHVFFIFVVVAHFFYYLLNRSFIELNNQRYYLLFLSISLLIYYTWLQLGIINNIKIYNWAKGRLDLPILLNRWMYSITSIFYIPNTTRIVDIVMNYLLLIVVLLALIYLIKNSKRETWTFLVLLMSVPFLSLFFWDMFFDMKYSSVGRFYLPTLLSIVLTVAFLISQGILNSDKKVHFLNYLCLGLLIWLEMVSNLPLSQNGIKYRGYGSVVPNATLIINQSSKPLVISEVWLDILPLSHKAKETTNYLLIKNLKGIQNLEQIQNNYSDVYVLSPSSSLRQEFVNTEIALKKTENQALWELQL